LVAQAENLPQGRVWSDWILVAEYQGCDQSAAFSTSNYRIIHILKGPPTGVGTIRIREDLKGAADSPCERGSKWIVFIRDAIPKNHAFEIKDGADRKIFYSRHNLDVVLDEIASVYHEPLGESDRQKLNAGISKFKSK
jgi:hypothetical protein